MTKRNKHTMTKRRKQSTGSRATSKCHGVDLLVERFFALCKRPPCCTEVLHDGALELLWPALRRPPHAVVTKILVVSVPNSVAESQRRGGRIGVCVASRDFSGSLKYSAAYKRPEWPISRCALKKPHCYSPTAEVLDVTFLRVSCDAANVP